VLFDQDWRRRMRTSARLSLISGLIVDVLVCRRREGAKCRLCVRSARADRHKERPGDHADQCDSSAALALYGIGKEVDVAVQEHQYRRVASAPAAAHIRQSLFPVGAYHSARPAPLDEYAYQIATILRRWNKLGYFQPEVNVMQGTSVRQVRGR
jgi:hypothetical protein